MLSAGSKALLGHLDSSAMDIVTSTARGGAGSTAGQPFMRANRRGFMHNKLVGPERRYVKAQTHSAGATMAGSKMRGVPRRALPPPPKKAAGSMGKRAASWVRKHPVKSGLGLAAGLTVAGAVTNSGRAVDKTSGRPTGMYNF